MYTTIDEDEVFLREKTFCENWFDKTNYNIYSCNKFYCNTGKCDYDKCTKGDAPDCALFSVCLLPFGFVWDTVCLPCTFISNVCC